MRLSVALHLTSLQANQSTAYLLVVVRRKADVVADSYRRVDFASAIMLPTYQSRTPIPHRLPFTLLQTQQCYNNQTT
jgi:hypothetical protein